MTSKLTLSPTCVVGLSSAVRPYQRLSMAHVLHLSRHAQRKSMTSHKNDPGRKFKCQTHTEICLKRGEKGGGTVNKYPVIN